MLITFEGGEGSGKTSTMNALSKELKDLGFKVVVYFEPGSTPLGVELREMVLSPKRPDKITALSELMMFAAARAQFVETELEPMLKYPDTIILLDRFTDSTIAYQAHGRGLPLADVEAVTAISSRGIVPDLTFFFDIHPSLALKRLISEFYNRLDAEDFSFHERVYNAYLHMVHNDHEKALKDQRWRLVNATQPKEKVIKHVLYEVVPFIHTMERQ